jgi:PAS domain S-box-containing protein
MTTQDRPLILLVDDDEPARYVKSRLLRQTGWRVIEAGDGATTLELVETEPVDLVVLDVRLPDMSGLDACSRIKATRPDIMVLQTSATYTAAEHRVKGLDIGADAYLAEPCEELELIAQIRALLRIRMAERRLINSERFTRRVLDNLSTFVALLDRSGTLVEVNEAPLKVADLTSSSVLGKPFWECYWWAYSAEVQHRLKDVCGRALSGETSRFDVPLRVASGKLMWVDFQIGPLHDDAGRITHLIASALDLTPRKNAEDALEASRDFLRRITDIAPIILYVYDMPSRQHVWMNASVRAVLGFTPDELRDMGEDGVRALVHPDDKHLIEEHLDRLRSVSLGQTAELEFRLRHKDGGWRWLTAREMPYARGESGEVVQVVGAAYDTTERRHAEEHINLLMREVNHRSKNLLSVVQAVARQTSETASPRDFAQRLSTRLQGLSASQDLLIRSDWQSVDLQELIRSQLSHLSTSMHHRVQLTGQKVQLSPAAAQGIGMALHELATNAMKYGSLSSEGGQVLIAWSVADDADPGTFELQWTEEGGPVVIPPSHSGFGRIVIEQMAARSVGGTVDLSFERTGVKWKLRAPLDSVGHPNSLARH